MNRCGIAWFLAIYKVMKCYFTKKAANQPLPSGGVYRSFLSLCINGLVIVCNKGGSKMTFTYILYIFFQDFYVFVEVLYCLVLFDAVGTYMGVGYIDFRICDNVYHWNL